MLPTASFSSTRSHLIRNSKILGAIPVSPRQLSLVLLGHWQKVRFALLRIERDRGRRIICCTCLNPVSHRRHTKNQIFPLMEPDAMVPSGKNAGDHAVGTTALQKVPGPFFNLGSSGPLQSFKRPDASAGIVWGVVLVATGWVGGLPSNSRNAIISRPGGICSESPV